MPELASTEASAARDVSIPFVPPVELPHTRIEPKRGWVSVDLKDLWEYRELLLFLAWRDVKVRYKQTALGAAFGPGFANNLVQRVDVTVLDG